MCADNDDLESEYDNILFELSDVRERYPAKCANELGECLRLTTKINTKPLKTSIKENIKNISITEEQKMLYDSITPVSKDDSKKWKKDDRKIEKMLSQVEDLKVVLKQIQNAQSCSLNNIINKE